MALRTITIEDDDYEALENERDELESQAADLEDRVADLEGTLAEFEEKWDDPEALLKRLGEL